MRLFSTHYILTFLLVVQSCFIFSQNEVVQQQDSSGHSPDYLPVSYATTSLHHFTKPAFTPIDTSIVEIHHYNPLLRNRNIFQTLGMLGQVHKNMYFSFDKTSQFSYHTLPYPLYTKDQNDIRFYDLKSTYTKISYIYGIPEEDHFNLEFAQQLRQVQIAVNLYANYNAGYFLNQDVRNLVGDAAIHYETPNEIYGFRTSYIINRFHNHENGGLLRPYDYLEFPTENKKGYSVNSARAQMEINTHDVALQQYVNLKDKKKRYYGTFTHAIQYKQYRSLFTDAIDSTQHYPPYYVTDVDSLIDSTRYFSIVNSIQYSNYSPYSKVADKKYFIRFAGGVMHEYSRSPIAPLSSNSITPFVRARIRLFSVMDLHGTFTYSFMGYNRHDAIARLGAEWAINREKRHFLGVKANFFRVSPDYDMSYMDNTCFQWDTTWKKQNIAELGAYWKFRDYSAEVNYYILDKYTLLGSDLRPYQLQNTVSLIQGNIYAPFRYKGFGTSANLILQYCNNDSIQVPLFAFKLSTYYVFHLFKRKMQLQVGADLSYNTAYYANDFCPNINAFYLQNSDLVGNFFYFDAFVNVRVSRMYLFFRIGNLLSPVQRYNMFHTPDYPVNDFHISIGINWRFHD